MERLAHRSVIGELAPAEWEPGFVDYLYVAFTNASAFSAHYRQEALARVSVELREDVVGAGQWRGGLGSVREIAFLEDGGASVRPTLTARA